MGRVTGFSVVVAALLVVAPVRAKTPIVKREMILFASMPTDISARNANAFSDWFSITYPANLPIPAETPRQEGWQYRRSYVRVLSDRIIVDAPMPPGIGLGFIRVCRITIPLGEHGNAGYIVDASDIGFPVTSGDDSCTENTDRLIEIAALPKTATYGRAPEVTATMPKLGKGWSVTYVNAWNLAVQTKLLPVLRASGEKADPVVMMSQPKGPHDLEKLDPLQYSFFYADGSVVTSMTIGFSVKGGDGNLPMGACIIRDRDRKRLFDDDPAVLGWCRAQAENARKAIDQEKIRRAGPLTPLPAPPPPSSR